MVPSREFHSEVDRRLRTAPIERRWKRGAKAEPRENVLGGRLSWC